MKLIDMIESQVKRQINTATEEAKKEIAYSTKVAKLRKKAKLSYHLKQQGRSTSFHHLFLDDDKRTIFEIKPKFGFKNISYLYKGDSPIGNITIKNASHHHGLEAVITLGQETVGSVLYIKNKWYDRECFYSTLIPEWEIEKGANRFILLHNGDPECVFSYSNLIDERIDVISDNHLNFIMLLCSAILLINVEAWRSEKSASGSG